MYYGITNTTPLVFVNIAKHLRESERRPVDLYISAFGPGIGFCNVLLVYLGASILSSATPTPGNLGAAEASLAVGLSLTDVAMGHAIVSVLTYRLLTFWIPIIPGLFALRYLSKHHDI